MTTVNKTLAVIVCALCWFVSFGQELKVYMGLLHAHTMISDGSGTPEEAYAMAKQNHLDFFAVTPHNHADAEDGAKGGRRDGVLIATNNALYNGTANVTVTRRWQEDGVAHTETVTLKPLLKAASDATTTTFLPLYGQEFSTISSGNHVNVLGIDDVITVHSGDFSGLIALLEQLKQAGKPLPVLQLNHPDVHGDLFSNGTSDATRRRMFNDYGIDADDLGPHFRNMTTALNPYVSLIEVLSGPAMDTARPTHFKYTANEDDYFFYLTEGLHVSPSVGQDNHFKTWGSITDARTGVLASALTRDAVFDAFRRHRTFASEDKNLHVQYTVNDSLMGSFIQAAEESELHLQVTIDDADEPHASYTIELYRNTIQPQLSTQATEWKQDDGFVQRTEVTGNGTFPISTIVTSSQPSFLYLKVIQNDDDRLWTAPVWINEATGVPVPEAQFFWTKSTSSHVYHKRGCSAINLIKPENLMQGNEPPPGRTLHACTISEEPEP